MKRLHILSVMVLVALQSQAQNFNWEALSDQRNRLNGKLSGLVYYVSAEGSSRHFYHENWLEGSILLTDGDLFEGLRLRYLAYGDELVVYNPALKQLFIVDKEKVAAFTANLPQGKQMFVRLYFNGFIPGYRYFEQLYDGPHKLLAFHSIDEQKTAVYRASGGKLRDSELKLSTAYYIYNPDTGFKRLQPRRSSFLNLFPDKKKDIRKIFRKNNLSRLTEKEMVRVFNLLEAEGFF